MDFNQFCQNTGLDPNNKDYLRIFTEVAPNDPELAFSLIVSLDTTPNTNTQSKQTPTASQQVPTTTSTTQTTTTTSTTRTTTNQGGRNGVQNTQSYSQTPLNSQQPLSPQSTLLSVLSTTYNTQARQGLTAARQPTMIYSQPPSSQSLPTPATRTTTNPTTTSTHPSSQQNTTTQMSNNNNNTNTNPSASQRRSRQFDNNDNPLDNDGSNDNITQITHRPRNSGTTSRSVADPNQVVRLSSQTTMGSQLQNAASLSVLRFLEGQQEALLSLGTGSEWQVTKSPLPEPGLRIEREDFSQTQYPFLVVYKDRQHNTLFIGRDDIGTPNNDQTSLFCARFRDLKSSLSLDTRPAISSRIHPRIPHALATLPSTIFSTLSPYFFFRKCIQENKWAFVFYSPVAVSCNDDNNVNPSKIPFIHHAIACADAFTHPLIQSFFTHAYDINSLPLPERNLAHKADLFPTMSTHHNNTNPNTNTHNIQSSSLSKDACIAATHIPLKSTDIYKYFQTFKHQSYFNSPPTTDLPPVFTIIDPLTHAEFMSYNFSHVYFGPAAIPLIPWFHHSLVSSFTKFTNTTQKSTSNIAIRDTIQIKSAQMDRSTLPELNDFTIDVSKHDPTCVLYAMLSIVNNYPRVPGPNNTLTTTTTTTTTSKLTNHVTTKTTRTTPSKENTLYSRGPTEFQLKNPNFFINAQLWYIYQFQHYQQQKMKSNLPPRNFFHLLPPIQFLDAHNITKVYFDKTLLPKYTSIYQSDIVMSNSTTTYKLFLERRDDYIEYIAQLQDQTTTPSSQQEIAFLEFVHEKRLPGRKRPTHRGTSSSNSNSNNNSNNDDIDYSSDELLFDQYGRYEITADGNKICHYSAPRQTDEERQKEYDDYILRSQVFQQPGHQLGGTTPDASQLVNSSSISSTMMEEGSPLLSPSASTPVSAALRPTTTTTTDGSSNMNNNNNNKRQLPHTQTLGLAARISAPSRNNNQHTTMSNYDYNPSHNLNKSTMRDD